MLSYILLFLASLALVFTARRRLHPKPFAGIPYNKQSAHRLTGDIPELVPVIKATNEYSASMFAISTQQLRQPSRRCCSLRRGREFDRAPISIKTLKNFFPYSFMGKYNTPEIKEQKRVWADAFGADFLRRVAAPSIYKATLDLLELWRLKADGRSFEVVEDLHNATLDAIWVALVGEEAGITRHEIKKLLQSQSDAGDGGHCDLGPPPRGYRLRSEVDYVSEMIAKNSSSRIPVLVQKLAAYLPRHRQFRRTVDTEIGLVMRKAVDRFQRLELGKLEAGENDTCMMDLVLRRKVLEAKKSGRPLMDPTKDKVLLDDTFLMMFAGYETTANSLIWFMRYMESYPAAQADLRAALKAAFPHTTTPSVDELLGADIPYLDAACEESLRLAGVAKGNLRQAVVDMHILGHFVPKGAEIFMNYHVDHAPYPVDEEKRSASSRAAEAKLAAREGILRDVDVTRDLGSFEPRRWLVKDEKTGKEVFDAYALPQLAFGGGYRGCSGRKLAVMEFRTVVALLVLNLEFLELPEDMKTLNASETIFRLPDMTFASLRAL
ncbi:Cytochrome P450 [Apiospora hydei]|uniref:Cytochrome P450 n=1 Tax=Apiospora hydei TaxID=1337664 RepID=A0ABR1XB87_9PEZI